MTQLCPIARLAIRWLAQRRFLRLTTAGIIKLEASIQVLVGSLQDMTLDWSEESRPERCRAVVNGPSVAMSQADA